MFNGAGVAIVTPFKDGKFDKEAYERLIDFQIENSTQALIVLGTTGEATTISFEERAEIIKTAIEKNKSRLPIIVGTGSNSTETALKLSKQAEDLGADGLLVVTPYYNKATDKGLVKYFSEIAKSTSLPVILYNVPGRTNVNIKPHVVEELAKIDNIVGIKEASGDMGQILEIKRRVDEDFKIYSGNDDQIVPVYSCGGHGVISVASNIIPSQVQEMCRLYEEERPREATSLQVKYKRLIDLLFIEVNPIPVKAALCEMGLISPEIRSPLTEMEEETKALLIEEMKAMGLV